MNILYHFVPIYIWWSLPFTDMFTVCCMFFQHMLAPCSGESHPLCCCSRKDTWVSPLWNLNQHSVNKSIHGFRVYLTQQRLYQSSPLCGIFNTDKPKARMKINEQRIWQCVGKNDWLILLHSQHNTILGNHPLCQSCVSLSLIQVFLLALGNSLADSRVVMKKGPDRCSHRG